MLGSSGHLVSSVLQEANASLTIAKQHMSDLLTGLTSELLSSVVTAKRLLLDSESQGTIRTFVQLSNFFSNIT